MTTTTTSKSEVPTQMKAAFLTKNGDPTLVDVLAVKDDCAVPEPGENEILIRVAAAAINPVDWKLMKGDFPGLKQGLVGCDVSGTIVKVGPMTASTTDWNVGDDIYADAIATPGAFAEYALVQNVAACRKPSNLDFAQAAALPLAGLTALQGLVTHGNLQAGQSVCILGGSGGVGSLAVQMAKALGASRVMATGSSVDMIQGLGADTVINYKEQSVVDELKGQELDIVFDTIGGKEGWDAAQGALKKGGIFLTIVGDGGGLVSMVPGIVWRKIKATVGLGHNYTIFLTNTKGPDVTRDMLQMTKLVEAGKVKPILDDTSFVLTTESVHDMIKASMSHRAKGKLILKVNC